MAPKAPQRNLSKSKVMAFRQCPRRIWLEVHHPELAEPSDSAQARFRAGHEIGAIARRLFDPDGRGTLLDPRQQGFQAAVRSTRELLSGSSPIFEATFVAAGALALADVMVPDGQSRPSGWRMIEVKSSTQVKPYHLEDVAIQTYVAQQAGVPLTRVDVAHVDNTWVCQGDENYAGLLTTVEVTDHVRELGPQAQQWIADAHAVVSTRTEPDLRTGAQCHAPYDCPFLAHCRSTEPQPEHDARWLPRIQNHALRSHIDQLEPAELRDIPDRLLNEQQRRVKACTLSGEVFFDADGAAADLKDCTLPAVFLDFETVNPAVPRWKGTRPYQLIPFQFSAHILHPSMQLEHREFLDLSGDDPRPSFLASLIDACGETGPIFVYNATFEKSRIKELAEQFPDARGALLAIDERIFDLLPVARNRYYHPDQRGSWSIKRLLPCIAPELSYELLDGISEGGAAMDAYYEATASDTGSARKAIIEDQLLTYCGRDTEALVRLWAFLAGGRMPPVAHPPSNAEGHGESAETVVFYGNMDWWEPEESPDDFSDLPEAFARAKSLWDQYGDRNFDEIAALLSPYVRALFIPGNISQYQELIVAQRWEEFPAFALHIAGVDYSKGILPACKTEAWFRVPVTSAFASTDIEEWAGQNGTSLDCGVSFMWKIPAGEGAEEERVYIFGNNQGTECVPGWNADIPGQNMLGA